MKSLLKLAVLATVSAFVLAPNPVAAQSDDPSALPDGTDVKGSADHPLIQRFRGSSIRFAEKRDFDELVMSISGAIPEPGKTRTVEGARTTLVYVMPAGLSTLEALRGYQAELGKLGTVTVLYQGVNSGATQQLDNFINGFYLHTYGEEGNASRWMPWNKEYRYSAFQVKRPEGDMFVTIYAGFNVETSAADDRIVPFGRVGVRMDVIETKSRTDRMVTVTSAEMSAEIAKSGRVALYGILFDTAKTDIKPESEPALQEIVKLMKAEPKLRLLVVGHTDTVGAFEGNLDLSKRRAQSVVAALTTRLGVDATRLQSFGASFAAPVASNGAEAGRAKNRRVELVAY